MDTTVHELVSSFIFPESFSFGGFRSTDFRVSENLIFPALEQSAIKLLILICYKGKTNLKV